MTLHFSSKRDMALHILREQPLAWFRDAPIDMRDTNLIRAEPVPWLDYSQGSFLRKIYHMKAGEEFQTTDWVVENEEACKELVRSAGGQLVGYDNTISEPIHWASMTVNVNVSAKPGYGFDWGFLSTRPSNIRIFKGPPETCAHHPWDAMILRDCTGNTGNLNSIESIAQRKWDILCMKMCEDYDSPWVVAAIKDSGERAIPGVHDCQDTSACGCMFAH
ncbi:hypothetical protein, variant [Phialophora macrospora]|uniref:Uncharacterized protein n=1 Tax=Phialophora macrospora TaxID=1851006 RepID=A0A0D2CZE9_9EURO|nr:hypothetical protein PV04_02828 [Phialophora macrospora]KIW70571.1 hypothetical protein, variant [Phialophora macrospora]